MQKVFDRYSFGFGSRAIEVQEHLKCGQSKLVESDSDVDIGVKQGHGIVLSKNDVALLIIMVGYCNRLVKLFMR